MFADLLLLVLYTLRLLLLLVLALRLHLFQLAVDVLEERHLFLEGLFLHSEGGDLLLHGVELLPQIHHPLLQLNIHLLVHPVLLL